MDEVKTYQARFRVDSSYFTLDLNAPLSHFWGDIIVSFDPPSSELTGLYEGLQFTGESYGDTNQIRRLFGPRCQVLLYISGERDVQIETLMFTLQEMDIRRVILTEPADTENAALFVSKLVEMSTTFLAYGKREICYSTTSNSLYELAFRKLADMDKPTFDEANAVIDEDALLRFLLLSLQCEHCCRFSISLGISECCRRLYCANCSVSFSQCQFCNSRLNTLPATIAQRILASTELTCGCGKTATWQDYDRHAATCSSLQVSCACCEAIMPRPQYLQHLADSHARLLLANFVTVVSGKEQMIMNLRQRMVEQPLAVWTCDECSNANLLSSTSCIRCGMSRR